MWPRPQLEAISDFISFPCTTEKEEIIILKKRKKERKSTKDLKDKSNQEPFCAWGFL
jgi:hypothetical protein